MGSFKIGEHTLQGNFRSVVGTAEVGEPEPAHTVGTPGAQNGVGGLIIGEVAGGTEDTLFENIGIRAAHEPFAIMVGLKNEQVGMAHHVEHRGSDFAGIGDDAYATATGTEQIATR